LGRSSPIGIHLSSSEEAAGPVPPFHWWDPPVAAVALAAVLLSSHYFVGSATVLAARLGVSSWIIGITVAAIGTSLPELVTCLAAAWQKRPGLIVGNLLGSNAMNILFVLGSASAVAPVEVDQLNLVQAAMFAGLTTLPVVMMRTRLLLARWEGAVLLCGGIGWMIAESLELL
jgi:cation:H+ antiporter